MLLLIFCIGVIKRQSDYLYDSVDLDVTEMHAEYNQMGYLKFKLFETSTTSTDKWLCYLYSSVQISSTKVESLPSAGVSTSNNSEICDE